MKRKIEEIRSFMRRMEIDALILTGQDPWGSEYVSDKWMTRKHLTGFTGSAGTVVITCDHIGLWTDFRYFIQAERELEGTGVHLYRLEDPGVTDWDKWLLSNGHSGFVVGIDPETISCNRFEKLRSQLAGAGLILKTDGMDFMTRQLEALSPQIATQNNALWFSDSSICGMDACVKIEWTREWIVLNQLDGYFFNALDDQCWLLNMRGNDIPYNQLVEGYLFVTVSGGFYLTRKDRTGEPVKSYLKSLGIDCFEEPRMTTALLESFPDNGLRTGYDPDQSNYGIIEKLSRNFRLVPVPSPVKGWKAVKTDAEIRNTEISLAKDNFGFYLFEQDIRHMMTDNNPPTEDQAAEILCGYRQKWTDFLGESFATICAAGENSAICHYHADKGKGKRLNIEELFLVDSGSHYKTGTTDLTRTLSFSRYPGDGVREDYTLVLKAHIALATARFPAGTRGYQLDALARRPLWDTGRQYGHGTGHGVGFLLTVHEGPQSISPRPLDVKIEPGMIVSCEPGIYREGTYGIRLENLLVCEKDEDTPFGPFLCFRTLSYYPFEEDLIIKDLLTPPDQEWLLDYYHKMIFLSQDENFIQWLTKREMKLKIVLHPG